MESKATYTLYTRFSCVLMIASLLWLTVSLPFVTSFQERLSHELVTQAELEQPASHCDDNNSLPNSTEEKNSSSNSVSEEYLHGHPEILHHLDQFFTHIPGENENISVTFTAELLSPPPELLT